MSESGDVPVDVTKPRVSERIRKAEAARAARREQQQEILEGRIAGFSFSVLARRLGIAEETARRLYDAAMREQRDTVSDSVAHYKALSLARLDRVIALVQPSLVGRAAQVDENGRVVRPGLPGANPAAAKAVADAVEKQCKILGIYSEDRLTVSIINSPQWQFLAQVIYGALAAYPEARAAVEHALEAALNPPRDGLPSPDAPPPTLTIDAPVSPEPEPEPESGGGG